MISTCCCGAFEVQSFAHVWALGLRAWLGGSKAVKEVSALGVVVPATMVHWCQLMHVGGGRCSSGSLCVSMLFCVCVCVELT